jgi:NADH:ubiquinone oxidoreductase subunit 3 (subunit A)
MGTTVEKKDPVEVLVLIVIAIAVLVLGVAIGPLLAMRNPAEADKLTPGADPAGESSKEPDASESSIESPTPRHTEDQP